MTMNDTAPVVRESVILGRHVLDGRGDGTYDEALAAIRVLSEDVTRLATRQQPEAGREGDDPVGYRLQGPEGEDYFNDTTTPLSDADRANGWTETPLYAATRLAVPTGVGREEVARVREITPSTSSPFLQSKRMLRSECNDRIREWRTAFDEMHQRAMRAEALVRSHAEAGGVEGWRTMTPDEAREMLEYDADTIINCMTEWGFVASPAAVAGGGV